MKTKEAKPKTARLRLDKIGGGAEQVRDAEKDEPHMARAEDARTARCFKCWHPIGFQPFFRVDDRLVHASCTKAL